LVIPPAALCFASLRYNRAMSPEFGSTQWTLVLAAKNIGDPQAEAALASLCVTYWRPLYAFVRRSGRSVEDAQDLTQAFFLHLLERDFLRRVEPSLGKFRTFLLTCLKNFLTNEWRRESAGKRGGAAPVVSLEEMGRGESFYLAAPAASESPDRLYERNWAIALVERAVAQLGTEFESAGKSQTFAALKPYLTGDRDKPYAAAAAELGLSEIALRVAVHRMRGRFRDLLLREVAQTLPDPTDRAALEEELRYLLAAM
jgi:RNA polymerase sigma-70 factor (ECF subfamily)